MCSKSLIILVFGCTLASANPIQGNGNLTPQGNTVDIGSWLNDAHYEIRNTFKQTVKPFTEYYDALIEASTFQEYSKDKIEQLRFLFHKIIDKSRENLSDIEKAILTSTIVNLQRAVEFLSTKPTGNGIVQGSYQNIQSGQQMPNNGHQNIQKIIYDQGNKVGQSMWSGFNGAQQTVNNMGQKVQRVVNNKLENVNDNLDGGFYFKPGKVSIADKLGGGVDNILNGVENVEDIEKTETINENAGFVSNLGNQGQVFDSRQVLNNIGEQLANIIAVQMSEVEKNLYEWKNLVESFFANSEKNVEQQTQVINKDINGPGSIGYMPSTDEGIEVPKNPIAGIFGNIGQKVGEHIASAVDKITGVVGSIEYKPNIDKEIELPKNKNDGIFSKIGKKVGGDMGSGVDKFSDVVGGFFNNGMKLFG